MKAISQLVIHICELIEAEGRGLRTAVRAEARDAQSAASRMALGVAFLAVAAALLVGGLGLVAAGFVFWLESQLGFPAASAVTGLILLIAAVGFLHAFRSHVRSSEP